MRLSQTHQFKKDIKRAIKRGKDLAKLKAVIDLLLSRTPLPPKNRDHELEPDWILIYKILDEEIRLERTGTHSDLF
jgi:mRNA interferase YafQ